MGMPYKIMRMPVSDVHIGQRLMDMAKRYRVALTLKSAVDSKPLLQVNQGLNLLPRG